MQTCLLAFQRDACFSGEVCDIGTKTDKTTALFPNCCHFPFSYNFKEYHSCTLEHSKDGKYWCSFTGLHIAGLWGHCGKYYMECIQPRSLLTMVFRRYYFKNDRHSFCQWARFTQKPIRSCKCYPVKFRCSEICQAHSKFISRQRAYDYKHIAFTGSCT